MTTNCFGKFAPGFVSADCVAAFRRWRDHLPFWQNHEGRSAFACQGGAFHPGHGAIPPSDLEIFDLMKSRLYTPVSGEILHRLRVCC
jgi:hypothetical protein